MYTRQRLVDHSDFSIKQINDNFSAIFLKLSGNIDTIDLKNNAITTEKIKDKAVTAEKIVAGCINIGHLDSNFINNFPLLDNPTFISYSESVDNNFVQQATLIQQNNEQISLHATKIDGLKTDYASLSIRADEIQSNVTSVKRDVSYNSSQISQMADNISSKVSYTDYNGREIVSLIEQTASSVKISADKIDLTGITTLYDCYDSSFYVESRGRGLCFYGDRYEYLTIGYRDPNTAVISSPSCLYFEGDIDFAGAHIYGLSCIESYYSSNKCYIDYGDGDRLTVRNSGGNVVGYLLLA